MKKLLLISAILIACFGTNSFGQKDRMFHTIGSCVFTDLGRGPVSTYTENVGPLDNIEVTYYSRMFYWSYYTIFYNFRYNLKEFSDNSALGLNAAPALGIAMALSNGNGDEGGFGNVSLPVYATYDMGAGSTYKSTANMGGFVGLGLELNKAPLIVVDKPAGREYKTLWVEPMVKAGIRYWNKKNKLREIALKYGFGLAGKDYGKDLYYDSSTGQLTSGTIGKSRSFTLSLSWAIFLNY